MWEREKNKERQRKRPIALNILTAFQASLHGDLSDLDWLQPATVDATTQLFSPISVVIRQSPSPLSPEG